jgi:hypothetical protein
MATKNTTDKHSKAAEALGRVFEVLDCFDCEVDGCPSSQIIAVGASLIAIGNAVADLPLESTRRVLRSAAILHGIEIA